MVKFCKYLFIKYKVFRCGAEYFYIALGQIIGILQNMLKKSLKPETNSFMCIEMMLKGAKKRRMMAMSAIKALEGVSSKKSNVVSFR